MVYAFLVLIIRSISHDIRSKTIFPIDINRNAVRIERMSKSTVMVTWIGVTDYQHAFGSADGRPVTGSPAASVMASVRPKRVLLLWGDSPKTPLARAEEYRAWLREQADAASIPEIEVIRIEEAADNVMNFGWVYSKLDQALRQVPTDSLLAINASSGTPIMTAAWIVFAKAAGSLDCTLYVSSKEKGVQPLDLPAGLRIDLRQVIAMTDDDRRTGLLSALFDDESRKAGVNEWIGDSDAIKRVKSQAFASSKYDVPILITGAPGSGKSVLAESIHSLSGRGGKLVTVDCGQLYGDTEVHSVFGWEKGAFTGANTANPGLVAEALDGTIFLDEIGNAPPIVQSSLLRFLQTRKYRPLRSLEEKDSNARVVAATNADFASAVRQGKFRQDLLDRLRGVHIELPSLGERNKDVLALAHAKLAEFQKKHVGKMRPLGSKAKQFDASAQKVLLSHDWPGNVRELEQLVARLVIFNNPNTEEITAADVQRQILSGGERRGDSVLDRSLDDDFDLDAVTREVQLHYVREAAQKSGGNKAEMARLLGYGDSRTPVNTMLKSFIKHSLPNPMAP